MTIESEEMNGLVEVAHKPCLSGLGQGASDAVATTAEKATRTRNGFNI